jgi:Flp pilus assembly protein protease CpaA
MAEATRIFRLLNFEQRMAAVGALLLAISTFGPFSFVELAEITIAVAVLALLRARGLGREFHLPFGDGTVIAAAGIWAGLLIVVRLFDRPLGQNLLALVCAGILTLAGLLERAKRPADDLPPAESQPRPERRRRRPPPASQPNGEAATEPLPPPEFKPYKPEPGQQLHLGGEEDQPPDDA